MKRLFRFLITAVIGVFVPLSLVAQGNSITVKINEIDLSQFPSVLLRLHISKPLNSSLNVDASNARLSENGVLQQVEFLDCPQDSSIRLSLAILLDRSGSMTRDRFNRYDPDSTKIRAAKSAIGAFLDLLGDRDEAAIFSFTTGTIIPIQVFRVEHDFSTDIASLKGSLASISAEGGTRLWESIIDAVELLRVRPGRKALIVVTDGRNQFGGGFRSRAIQNAIDEGIPVYPIGLGDDIDIGELSALAAATGGRFYPAPDANDLQAIFNQLGSELITDDCVLRYTSSNPCLDGSRRDIQLTVTGSGFFGEDDSSYVVERRLNPVTLFVEQGVDVVSGDTAVIPVSVLEQFSTSQPISYMTTVTYDPSFMRFLGVLTVGTMSDGQQVEVFEDTPGTLRIQLMSFLPALPTGHLFELQFETLPRAADSTALIGIADGAVIGLCPFEMSMQGGMIGIRACEESFTLGAGETLVSGDQQEVSVPLLLEPAPESGRRFNMQWTLDVTDPALEYVDAEAEGTIAENANVLIQREQDRIEFSLDSPAALDRDTLLILRFRTFADRQPKKYPLDFAVQKIVTGCRIDFDVNPPVIMVDGICQPILRRRAQEPQLLNFPNPARGRTTLSFSPERDGPVELLLLDGSGRIVRTLLNAHLHAGSYEQQIDVSSLPAGEYLAVLRLRDQTVVRRLLVLQ